MNQFHYSGQIRRFIIQFMRLFSHFQVEFGVDSTGNKALQQVPVYYGDSSRQVAQIIRGNSENALPTVPAITCYISNITYDRGRVQNPTHVSKMQIRERGYVHPTDTEAGYWNHDQGATFTVERMMPAPYTIELKVDIWTSNSTQKLQLFEQINPLFNPSMEIQSTDNYIDWTSLTVVELEQTGWTSRTIPMGAEDQIDVYTLTFRLPIWLSLPAKVKQMGVIQKIIMSIYDDNGDLVEDVAGLPGAMMLGRKIITPLDMGVVYFNGVLQLVRDNNIVTEDESGLHVNGRLDTWKTFIDIYGVLKNGISEVRLDQPNGSTLIGKVSYHPFDDTLLMFDPIIDTLPANTLAPVTAIIDPQTIGIERVIGVAAGTRYLLINDIGDDSNQDPAIAWVSSDPYGLVAHANDIIEFDGSVWSVVFSAAEVDESKYCTNLKSGIQYAWDGMNWTKSVEGTYAGGEWTLVL